MDCTESFRYAVLGILSRASGGLHGWAVKRECEAAFSCVWDVNVGRVYRALGQLSDAGLIEPVETIDVNDLTRPRKVFKITPLGQQQLARQFTDREEASEWAGRDEFAALFLFSEWGGRSARARLIERERQRCHWRLRAVLRRRRLLRAGARDRGLVQLLIDGAEMEVRARMAWLDRVEARLEVPVDPPVVSRSAAQARAWSAPRFGHSSDRGDRLLAQTTRHNSLHVL